MANDTEPLAGFATAGAIAPQWHGLRAAATSSRPTARPKVVLAQVRPMTSTRAAVLAIAAIWSLILGSAAAAQDTPVVLKRAPRLGADDLYAKLRALEYALPPVPATQTVTMGNWVAGGNFVGSASTCRITYSPVRGQVCTPPTVTVHAISAVLSFNVPNGVTLTANGRSVQSRNGQAIIDVGKADVVDWKLESGAYSYSDKVLIARPDVAGIGAFTIAALPITIVYEPVQNQAHTNAATVGFVSESTVVDTLTDGFSTTNTPTWAGGEAALMVGQKLASLTPQTSSAWPLLQGLVSALSSEPQETYGTAVNADHTLSLTMSASDTVATQAHRGPGHGDLIAFYKDARVIWGMDAGKVTLTLLDYGALSIFSVDQLSQDQLALSRGQAAQSGLDASSLKALIALDPMAPRSALANTVFSAPRLAPSRFSKVGATQVNATSHTHTFTHSLTTSDKVSKLQTKTTVTDSHGGWLTLLGIGSQTGGKTTTEVTLGSSRSQSSTETKSASYVLEAGVGETYKVEVDYDNIFGTFLVRIPQATIGPAQPAPPNLTPHG